MANVFISYSQAQRESAVELKNKLAKRGYSTWMDTGLVPGQNFNDTIRKELEEADAVIVIWSPEASSSDYVKMEAGIAWAWNKLLPVRLSSLPPKQIPDPFTLLQTVDVSDIEGLVETLKSRDIEPVSRQRMTMDEFVRLLLKDPDNAGLPAFLEKASAAGFRVVFKQSILIKATIPLFQEISFGTLLANGTVHTNYIADWAEKVGDPSIAAEYHDGVVKLVDNATVRRDNTPWTWRVEVWGALPKIGLLLARGDEWIELMKRTRERFATASATKAILS